MTAEDYFEVPERDGFYLELHLGHLVEVGRPKPWHVNMQHLIARLLEQRSGPDWVVRVELPFRAVAQYDVRAVDIGVVSAARWNAVGENDLFGSPEIVVEFLSPSNRRKQMAEEMALFLSTGTRQFCVVDRTRRTLAVTSADGRQLIYRNDDEVPFPLLGISIKVSEIFSGLAG